MANLPKLVVTLFETDVLGLIVASHGTADLSVVVADIGARNPARLKAWCQGEKPLTRDIFGGLPQSVIGMARDSRLSIPDFQTKVEAFVSQAGGLNAMVGLNEIFYKTEEFRLRLAKAESELSSVQAATWIDRADGHAMVWTRHACGDGDGFSSEANGIFEYVDIDDYIQKNPRPDWNSAEWPAWNAKRDDHVKRTSPPFVNATKECPWGGVEADIIREAFKDDPESFAKGSHVADLVESSLDGLYEDAFENVVDLQALDDLLVKWAAHAGTGTADDLALEAALAKWNTRQSITCFEPDYSIILPAFEGANHAEAIAWCKSRCEITKADLELAQSEWEPLSVFAAQSL